MEVVHHHQTPSEVSQVVEDIINSMPENVVTNIMNRLPLRDAVRTSILSTSWRYKWALLTQLKFDAKFFHYLCGQPIHFKKSNIIISRLLFHLKGAITKFVLHITDCMEFDVEDIHHWVMFLSTIRGFQELTLLSWCASATPVKLPTHLFSCLDLKHLYLHNCVLSPSLSFRGFPKLLSLDLFDVTFQDHKFGELIAQCPLLETLGILNGKLRGELKLAEIAKLKNVKVLSLSLCLLDNMAMVRFSQHMSLLPSLQELLLCFENCKFLPEDVAQNPVPITFPFLKILTLWEIDFSCDSMLSCVFRMLFGCANLQTLYITAIYKNAAPLPTIFSPDVDCSKTGQLQLRYVCLASIKGLENEVCLIKYMLACSPMLKRIDIQLNSSLESNDGNENDKFASTLSMFHRASPMVEILI